MTQAKAKRTSSLLHPRIAMRRQSVAQERDRKRTRTLAIFLVLIVVAGLTWGLLHSPLLSVKHLRISGVPKSQYADVLAAAQIHKGDNLISIDSSASEQRLEGAPWVSTAKVSVHWPNSVDVSVNLRKNRVFVQANDKFYVVSSGGAVTEVAKKQPEGLVKITGETGKLTVGQEGSEGLTKAARFVSKLPEIYRPKVTQIAIGPGKKLTATITGYGRNGTITANLGWSNSMRSAAIAVATMLEQPGIADAESLNVSVPDAPVLTGSTPPTTVSTVP